MLLLLLLAAALCQTQAQDSDKVVTTDPAMCVEKQGFLPDEDRPGGDCCHFIQCDATNLNMTGYVVACMYPLVWNKAISACDDDLNLDILSTCFHTDCSVKPPPERVCEETDSLESGECCIFGEKLIYRSFEDDEEFPDIYQSRAIDNDTWGEPQFCPGEQVFNTGTCCCEDDFIIMPECDGVELFQSDENNCCEYNQCFQNKTGFYTKMCMGGSVFNPKIAACDDVLFVPDCASDSCLDGVVRTQRPCPGILGPEQCCQAGAIFTDAGFFSQWGGYFVGDASNIENLNFCPQQTLFDLEQCSCVGTIELLDCKCLHFPFEGGYRHTDQLQNVTVFGIRRFGNGMGGTSEAARVNSDDGDEGIINYFSRAYLGDQFTFAFYVNAEGNIFSNGDANTDASLDITIVGGQIMVDITIAGNKVSLSGFIGDEDHVAIVKTLTTIKLYINGAETDSVDIKGNYDPTDCPLKIGGVGRVDELLICHFSYDQDLLTNLVDNGVVATNN